MADTANPTTNINYEAVLADLEQRRASIEIAIDVIQQLIGQGITSGPSIGLSEAGATEGSIPSDFFFGMSIADATRKYLGTVRKPKTTREITIALEAGGLTHTSKDFMKTVSTILNQKAQKGDEITKVHDKWGLASWYPGRKRGNREE